MKIYCKEFDYWIYHPADPELVCENRAKKLGLPKCKKCRGIPSPEPIPKEKPIPQLILLNVDRDKWIEKVREIQKEYEIEKGKKPDATASRRIAVLLGEAYIEHFGEQSKVLLNVPIVEKDMYDMALENRLICPVLEREKKVKPHRRMDVLCTWGVDKTSGVEGYTTQLKEWAAIALLAESKEKEENGNGEQGTDGQDHHGSGSFENLGIEKVGIGLNA